MLSDSFILIFLCLFQTQRRQQKQGTKLALDLLTNQDEGAPLEAPPPNTNEQLETESQSGPLEQNQEMPADEEEEEEAQNPTSNRFISLLEEGRENQEVEEDEHEETQLIKSVRNLSISEEPKSKEVDPEVESGAESEPELGAGAGFVVVNADPKAAFSTLSSRAELNISECSVESSLHQFTQVEQLTDTNRLLCVTCSQSAAHGTHTRAHTRGVNPKSRLI